MQEHHALKVLRSIYRVTQKEVYESIGCSLNHYHNVETGKAPISNELRRKLAAFFKITPARFMLLAEEVENPQQAIKKIVGG